MIRRFQVAYSISDHRQTNLILESGTFPHPNINLLLLYMHEIKSPHFTNRADGILAKPAGHWLISYISTSYPMRFFQESKVPFDIQICTFGCRCHTQSDDKQWISSCHTQLPPYKLKLNHLTSDITQLHLRSPSASGQFTGTIDSGARCDLAFGSLRSNLVTYSIHIN